MTHEVLVVDDDPGLRLSMAANLEDAGLVVHCAGSGEEALQVLAREPGIEALLSDVRMPGMSGVELWRKVRQLRPGLPGVLMTAFSAEHVLQGAVQDGVYAVLHKPFDPEAAVAVVQRAAGRPQLLVVEPGDGRLKEAIVGAAVRAGGLDEAQDVVARVPVDVLVAELEALGWPGVTALRAAARLVGTVVVTGAPSPAKLDGVVQLAPPVSPADLRRVVAELRGKA